MCSLNRALAISCLVLVTMSMASPLAAQTADRRGASTGRGAHDRSEVA